jgi:hypothetical protein
MKIKWIGTQKLSEEIAPLLTQYETVFIECEYYNVLIRAIQALNDLHPGYQTDLFSVEWSHWNYNDPNNLTLIRHEMMRNPNERVYVEIHPLDKWYTICNCCSMHRKFDQDSSLIVTTLPYARKE